MALRRFLVIVILAFLISNSYSQNAAPVMSSANISPSSPATDQNLTAIAAATDADGDSFTFAYNWYVNRLSTTIFNHPFMNDSESTDNQTTYDISGNSLIGQLGNATVNDAAEPTIQTGASCKIGACYLFDGSNDYIQLNDTAIMNMSATQSFAISMWFKSVHGGNFLLSKGETGAAGGVTLDFSSTTLSFAIRGTIAAAPAAVVANSSTVPMLDNNWHQVIAVRDVTSDQLFLYIDGVFRDASTDTTTGSLAEADPVYIGASDTKASTWNGSLDEVRFYNRSLSADEVAALYYGENTFSANNITSHMETFINDKWNATVTPIDAFGLNGTPSWSNNTVTIAAISNTAPSITNLNITPVSP
ncbi:TPA: LamG domain-containing protein, partial [Candidatus Micrarchaeota archaeon]|nr:LamG domain-containing protein [Candidatus Micrarchaeota archaeon]